MCQVLWFAVAKMCRCQNSMATDTQMQSAEVHQPTKPAMNNSLILISKRKCPHRFRFGRTPFNFISNKFICKSKLLDYSELNIKYIHILFHWSYCSFEHLVFDSIVKAHLKKKNSKILFFSDCCDYLSNARNYGEKKEKIRKCHLIIRIMWTFHQTGKKYEFQWKLRVDIYQIILNNKWKKNYPFQIHQ